MLAARQELTDFYRLQELREASAAAYQQGLRDGRELAELAIQDRHENWGIGGFLVGLAVAGSVSCFMLL